MDKELDPTLSYGAGHWDGKHGKPCRGSSPEYEEGYLSGSRERSQHSEDKPG
jgi:hypothetical protein